MSIVRISGPDDPRISAYNAVQDAELLRQRGLFVAEGRLVVERLIGEGRFAIQSMLLSEAAFRAPEPALSALKPDVPISVCGAADFFGITGYVFVFRSAPRWTRSISPSPPALRSIGSQVRQGGRAG